MTRASCGLVRNATSSGTRAARQRSGSSVHDLGQVQLPVDERPPLGAGVGEKDAELAVVDLAGGARVLALHPHRGGALLEEAGLVDHQHPGRVAQVLDHIGAQVVADQVRVPVSGGQQPLHPIRGRLPGMLGQLPAVLATHVAEQPPQIGQHPPAWLGAGEPPRDPGVQRPKPRRPPLDLLESCLVGLRHVLPPPSRSALPAHLRPAAREPTSPQAKCGWSTRPQLATPRPLSSDLSVRLARKSPSATFLKGPGSWFMGDETGRPACRGNETSSLNVQANGPT